MKHLFSDSGDLMLGCLRRVVLLLGMGGLVPAAFGQSFGPMVTYPVFGWPSSVALGDMNGDGRLDIVVNAGGYVNVLQGQAGGSFAPLSAYATGGTSIFVISPRHLALGDVNGDGRLDIVVVNWGSNNVSVLLGQASGGFASPNIYPIAWSGDSLSVALGDINGDGRLDIVVPTGFASNANVLLGQAGGGFVAGGTYSVLGSRPYGLTLGDLNNDGRLDIVTANYDSDDVSVLLAQASSGFSRASTYRTGTACSLTDVVLGDVNGDGQLDIVANNYYQSNAGVLLGQRGGGFSPVTAYSTGAGSRPHSLALGDVNGDGRLDIVATNYDVGNMGVLLGQAGGSFAPVSTYPVGLQTGPNSVALGDVNGDGRLDMVTANYSANTVGVLLNTGTFTPLATSHPTAAEVTLAPNPAHDAFAVQLPAGSHATQAELLNALGQVVRRPSTGGAASFRVETSGLAPGVYTLRLLAGGAALARRVVLE